MPVPVTLQPGIQVLAFKLQEASALMQGDVRARLNDALSDEFRGSGHYGYYIDHSGDGDSGDVVYSYDGDVRMCPYEIATVGGKAAINLDMDNSRNVVPTTTYQEEADDDDHYAGMSESFRTAKVYSDLPLYERFISKADRDKAEDSDFAGKGKSFPILKRKDVSAAIHAMGRAGSDNYGPAQLKKNIVAIAKRKGWEDELPKTWRGDESKRTAGSGLRLVESAATVETIVLKEARADYEIKLIAPGEGASAFYPREVLKRDGPKVFGAGTHVYLNHPTTAEEAARPEGDVKNLAGVLTTAAAYHEAHAKGEGLYARMKVFADHGALVEDKAPYVGMSIRASGVAESGKQKNGKPILKELTGAESVDVVTRAGAGGLILTEAARPGTQEAEMTDQEITKLVESAVTKAVAAAQAPVKILEARALRGDAMIEANKILAPLSLNEAIKARVIDSVTREGAFPLKEGAIDADKFKELVMAEAKREGSYAAQLTGSGRVHGLGISTAVETDPGKIREAEKTAKKYAKRLREAETDVFGRLMRNPAAAEAAIGKVA